MSANLFTCHQPSRYGRRGQQKPKDLTVLDTSARAGGAEISRSPQPSRINTSARAGGVRASRPPQSLLLKEPRHVAAALRHPRRPDHPLTGAVRQSSHPSSLGSNQHSRTSARAGGARAPRPPQTANEPGLTNRARGEELTSGAPHHSASVRTTEDEQSRRSITVHISPSPLSPCRPQATRRTMEKLSPLGTKTPINLDL
jgi:hypothetical protein